MPDMLCIPDWAHDAVWYQVFPERFRNGEPRSNPQLSDTGEKVADWSVTPWGADWYAQEPWAAAGGEFYQSVYSRRFGGDLVGLRQKLDYLQDLGINALYLNPVFKARSLHKYDAACFHHVDPTLGPDRDGDLRLLAAASEDERPETWVWTSADRFLLELVRDAHQRGMRIILDGVFNHVGRDFFAFADVLKNGRASRYRDWFRILRWGKDGTFTYRGWFGHQGLPEFARSRENLAPGVKQYIFDITRRWMDPARHGLPGAEGIDGWRLDVAFCVPRGFWREWRTLVKSLNPDAYLTGEIVSMAPSYLRGDIFDGVMNYMWLFPTAAFFASRRNRRTASEFRSQLNRIRAAYPLPAQHAVQNLLDSHDVARIASMLENPDAIGRSWDDYFHKSRVKHVQEFDPYRPGPEAWQALRQMVIFQMTYLGAPMIYYGTESGMWGGNDPDNRQPMIWEDLEYEDEACGYGRNPARCSRTFDKALHAFFKQAIRLRRDHVVFSRGSLRWRDVGHPRVLAFERKLGGTRVRVMLNAGEEAVCVPMRQSGLDLWNQRKIEKGAIAIRARDWLILRLDV